MDRQAFLYFVSFFTYSGESVSAPPAVPLAVYTIQEGQTVYAGLFV